MSNTSISLISELRDATHNAHQRLESLPFAQLLASGELPLESYVCYLQGMAVIHSVLEHELPVESETALDAVWENSMRKLPALQQDLSYFSGHSLRSISDAHAAAEFVANDLLRRSTEQPLSMLGYLYVLEGSSLGASVLAPWARRAFQLNDGQGMRYLESYGANTRHQWESFCRKMDALDLDTEIRKSVVEAGVTAFEGIEAMLSCLYPFDSNNLELKVTTINPEAGTHPVPQDLREIEAARQAGRRSLEEYPYFSWRYGERGRRFTDSDGAWLVTLVGYPQSRIERQVDWLCKVLATRGMPSILLQRHLELLFEELNTRIQDKRDDYEKLLVAADQLMQRRRNRLGDDAFDALCDCFNKAVGPDWRRRLPGTAQLIVCAVVDEENGLQGTLKNTADWLTQSSVFPNQWIEAVYRCIEDTRSAIQAGR